MNILVTGGNGQLGNEMRNLAASSSNNWFFSDVTAPDGVETIPLDITDMEAISRTVRELEIGCIVNCAAYTNVDRAEDQEELAFLLNAPAAGNLAMAAAERDILLVHISTDYVFQGTGCLPCREDQPTSPTGAYGRTKPAGEQAVRQSGCRHIILRTAWLYSPYGNNFVKTVRRITAERESMNVVFDQVGTPTYAADLAYAIYDIVENGKDRGNEGTYHFSNEGVCSWYDFALAIAGLSGSTSCRISPCHSDEFPSKVRRPSFSVLDKSLFKETLQCRIPHWYDSLKKCIEILDSK